MQIELVHEIRTMGFIDRQFQIKQSGDLLVRASFGQEMQDLFFALCQEVRRVGLGVRGRGRFPLARS